MRPGVRAVLICLLAVAACSACAPALNWREVRPEGAALVAWLPCKPERLTRQVALAGEPALVEVLACTAEGSTWGLTSAEVGAAGRVGPVLAQLRAARSANLNGKEASVAAAALPGMTAAAEAVRLRVVGARPDGQPVAEESMLFAVGTRVFHAAVLGGEPSADALTSFFGNLKVQR